MHWPVCVRACMHVRARARVSHNECTRPGYVRTRCMNESLLSAQATSVWDSRQACASAGDTCARTRLRGRKRVPFGYCHAASTAEPHSHTVRCLGLVGKPQAGRYGASRGHQHCRTAPKCIGAFQLSSSTTHGMINMRAVARRDDRDDQCLPSSVVHSKQAHVNSRGPCRAARSGGPLQSSYGSHLRPCTVGKNACVQGLTVTPDVPAGCADGAGDGGQRAIVWCSATAASRTRHSSF